MSGCLLQPTLKKRGLLALLASLLLGGSASCQYVPVEPHPLMGEGEPPGYISGSIPDQYRGMHNPYTFEDAGALTEGASLYVSFKHGCVSCHGGSGRGDGPMWPYLEPSPADFASPPMLEAFRNHQDYVYWWVREGVPKTVMPAWQNRLSDTQTWQVITYAWYLGENADGVPDKGSRDVSSLLTRSPFPLQQKDAPEGP